MTNKTLECIISIFFVFLSTALIAQRDTSAREAKFFRVDVDVASPLYAHFFGEINKRKGYEAAVEYSLNDTLFLVAEIGFHQLGYSSSYYETFCRGSFLRLGINKNLLKFYNKNDDDIFYLGIRASSSIYNMDYAKITIANGYWGNQSLTVNTKTYMAFWLEAVSGMRIELFRSFFLGWDVRANFKLYNSNKTEFKTLFIPGYGGTSGKLGVWLNYSVGVKF